MSTAALPRMLSDILAQPESLAAVLEHQCGAGRAALEAAASAIRDARKVIITGMGASLFGATSLGHHLNARGLPCVVIEAGELLHYGGDIARRAVVILVSRSGETVEAVRLLPKLRESGAIIVGMTNVPATTVASQADFPILINSGRDEAVAVQTYTGTVLTTLLLGALAAGEDLQAEALRSIKAVRSTLAACHIEAAAPESFLTGASVVYLLGRGASLASAEEGALLFNETAKLPSVAMAAGNFRHGPIEVVDPAFRAYLFSSQPETAALDEALRMNLLRMGGQVRAVTVEPGYFAPIVEIIPLQMAAFQAALERNLTPGKFRYVSLVTTSETDFKSDGA